MIYTTPETKALFLLEIDRYGDNYTTNATIKSLQEAFGEIKRQFADEDKKIPIQDYKELEAKYFGKPWWGLFRNYVIYVDRFAVLR
jgi:hypothetical protein